MLVSQSKVKNLHLVSTYKSSHHSPVFLVQCTFYPILTVPTHQTSAVLYSRQTNGGIQLKGTSGNVFSCSKYKNHISPMLDWFSYYYIVAMLGLSMGDLLSYIYIYISRSCQRGNVCMFQAVSMAAGGFPDGRSSRQGLLFWKSKGCGHVIVRVFVLQKTCINKMVT